MERNITLMEDMALKMSMYQLLCRGILKEQGELKDYTVLNQHENFKDYFSADEFNMIIREKHKRQAKRCRTSNKVKEMMFYIIKMNDKLKEERYKLVFGTCTLDEKYIKRKDETKAKLINAWIKKHFVRALVNKDFGSKTEREHYHFIGITKEDVLYTERKSKKGYPLFTLDIQDYKFGFEPDLEIIDLKDIDKLKGYLLKLNNHSNKITTRNRLRDIQSLEWEMYETLNRKIEYKKANKHIKNATYVPLNKMSGTKVACDYTLTDEEIFYLFENGTIDL